MPRLLHLCRLAWFGLALPLKVFATNLGVAATINLHAIRKASGKRLLLLSALAVVLCASGKLR